MNTSVAGGFWGPPTSSVDWCEANYAHSPYVAELFNSASSLAIVAAGVAGWLLHRRVLERRFLFAFGLLALVGVGSVAFHGTLRRELQASDELPMLYLVVLLVYVLVENRAQRRFGGWFPAALVAYAAVATYLNMFTQGEAQFAFFHTTFGALELFCLCSVYLIHRRMDDPRARRLFRVGMSCYALAITLWFIDLRFCHLLSGTLPGHGVPNPQLHAVWHVLVSCGFYLLVLVIASARLRVLGRGRRIDFTPLPALRRSSSEPGQRRF